ncbi:hypothetical protein GOP47_0005908 [Adiantum capillus-veneris]|uniref:Uncharacterized protein n=1 Tax=Adiantum capillus-veneris TaxID=13818 RepID=A0A9D4V3E7_ADICA|nr:hypothetical protein GOP47_0005908 [Adiantum capillus-veneris]
MVDCRKPGSGLWRKIGCKAWMGHRSEHWLGFSRSILREVRPTATLESSYDSSFLCYLRSPSPFSSILELHAVAFILAFTAQSFIQDELIKLSHQLQQSITPGSF